MSDDPVLAKLNDMQRKLDASLTRLDALERLLNRMGELRGRSKQACRLRLRLAPIETEQIDASG
jgi:hypothetical protein